MRTAEQTFGLTGPELAQASVVDGNSMPSPIATTRVQNEPPLNPVRALVDPHGSAIFWIGLAAVLGLLMVTGQARIAGALNVGGRAGRR